MALVFGLTLVGSVVMALTMSWVLQAAAALYGADISVGAGALIGALMGLGIAAAASLGPGCSPGRASWSGRSRSGATSSGSR